MTHLSQLENWLLPKITHNIVVTMIEYFYISVVFPISLSLSTPFFSLLRSFENLPLFTFSFFFFLFLRTITRIPTTCIDRSIFSKREVELKQMKILYFDRYVSDSSSKFFVFSLSLSRLSLEYSNLF